MNKLLIISFYAAVSAGGLALIKVSMETGGHQGVLHMLRMLIRDIRFISGFFLYGSGFMIWLYLLKRHDLSWIFPVAASSLIIATYLIGVFFLNEAAVLSRVIGILVIIAGIFILNYQ